MRSACVDAKQLLDSLDVGVLALAPDWTIAAWSVAAARITALPADRVVGGSIWIAFPAAKGTELELVLVDVLADGKPRTRSEEHTSELQSQSNLVCRLLLEKKKKLITTTHHV